MNMRELCWAAAGIWLALASFAAAQPQPSTSADRIRADVTFLADDRLQGRRAGEQGFEDAAAYVEQQFKAIGVLPAGANGGWRQPVPMARTGLAEAGASLAWTPARGAPVVWRNGVDALLDSGRENGQSTHTAQMVFVGFGIDAPTLGMDDYQGLDVRGKVAVVLSGAPAGTQASLVDGLEAGKGAAAAKHGAIGVLIVNTTASARRFTPELLRRSANRRSTTWVGGDGLPFRSTPGLRVGGYLSDTAAATLFRSAPVTYAAIKTQAARTGARPRGFAFDGSAAFDIHTKREDFQSSNVVAFLQGSDPALKDEVVVMTAHLDHLGVATSGEDRIYNGALDNAGGVAVMIEVARDLVAKPPRRSVLFVATTAEEMGLLGADYFVANADATHGRMIANVNIDVPILTYDYRDIIVFGEEHSTLGRTAAEVARAQGLGVSPDPVPAQNIFRRSDHFAFVRRGIPAVMIATGYANGGEAAWADFFTRVYHKPVDDLGLPFDWAAAARFAALNAAVVRTIADDEARPLWYVGNAYGDRYAPDQPKAPRN